MSPADAPSAHSAQVCRTSIGVDFFQKKHAQQTCVDLAHARLAAAPADDVREKISSACDAFLQRWQTELLPTMKSQTSTDPARDGPGLLPELADLVTQYIDGHGRAFKQKEDEKSDGEARMEE